MKYLKKSAGYVILIIALLFLQAYCDLSLPDYTSKIVNVGIQQSGIEDSVPEKIRKTSMDSLKLFMDENDKETVDSFYEENGDNLVLKNDVTSEERDKLNDILAKPMMIAASFLSGSDEVTAMLSQMGVPEGTDPMQAIAQMPEEALASMIGKISEKIDKMQRFLQGKGALMAFFAFLPFVGEAIAIALGFMRSNVMLTTSSMFAGKLIRYIAMLLALQGALSVMSV